MVTAQRLESVLFTSEFPAGPYQVLGVLLSEEPNIRTFCEEILNGELGPLLSEDSSLLILPTPEKAEDGSSAVFICALREVSGEEYITCWNRLREVWHSKKGLHISHRHATGREQQQCTALFDTGSENRCRPCFAHPALALQLPTAFVY